MNCMVCGAGRVSSVQGIFRYCKDCAPEEQCQKCEGTIEGRRHVWIPSGLPSGFVKVCQGCAQDYREERAKEKKKFLIQSPSSGFEARRDPTPAAPAPGAEGTAT